MSRARLSVVRALKPGLWPWRPWLGMGDNGRCSGAGDMRIKINAHAHHKCMCMQTDRQKHTHTHTHSISMSNHLEWELTSVEGAVFLFKCSITFKLVNSGQVTLSL